MLILSKFHDYDCISKNGIDKTIVYKRKESEVYEDLTIKNMTVAKVKSRTNFLQYEKRVEKFLVLFCGKSYVGFICKEESEFSYYNDTKNIITYDFDKAQEYYRFYKRIKWIGQHPDNLKEEDKQYWLENNNKIVDSNIFIDHKSPIMIVRNHQPLILNPCLSNYNFQSCVDPFTAFQEIQMYISGVLGSQKEIAPLVVDEKTKVASKGFDKWSFRKMKKEN